MASRENPGFPVSPQGRRSMRSLVALAGILVLTTTLASRTVDFRLSSRATVSSQRDKAKIQHRDKRGITWSPAPSLSEPFYAPLVAEDPQPEQRPFFSAHVDDCLYNRPPPLS